MVALGDQGGSSGGQAGNKEIAWWTKAAIDVGI